MINNLERKLRIEKIKEKSFIADAHLDLAYDLVRKRSWGRKNVLEDDYYRDISKGSVNLIISSIFIDDKFLPEMALKRGLMQFEALLSDIDESEHFKFASSSDDIKRNYEDGYVSIMMCFEGVEPIYDSIELLNIFNRLGLSGVGLAWSRRNFASDGSKFVDTLEGKQGGITEFGVKLLKKMEKEKLYLDLSHINEEGFLDALKFYKGKVMISHTNCRTLNNTMRNSSEDQLKKVIELDGFIGVNAMNFTVSNGTSPENIDGYCNHIDKIIKLGGENNVGFGFDFNDIILQHIPKGELVNLPREPFDCVKGYKDIDLIIDNFLSRGYSQETISKILGGNLFDFLVR